MQTYVLVSLPAPSAQSACSLSIASVSTFVLMTPKLSFFSPYLRSLPMYLMSPVWLSHWHLRFNMYNTDSFSSSSNLLLWYSFLFQRSPLLTTHPATQSRNLNVSLDLSTGLVSRFYLVIMSILYSLHLLCS